MEVDGQCDNDSTADGISQLSGFASSDLIGELTRRMQLLAEQESKVKEMERRISACVADPKEVLDINAGGQIHSVKRETLLLAKGSMLAAMFSGNWDNGLARDSQGRPFLEIDPYIFDKVVNYLRQKLIEGPDSPAPLPVIDPDRAREYKRVITYFGLSDLLDKAAPAKVQSLSREGTIATAMDLILPRGYVIRLTKPIRLKAVLVGLSPDSALAGARVVVRHGSAPLEAHLEVFNIASSEWTVSDQELTHCANFPDLILNPPEVFVMMTGNTPLIYKYVSGDNNARGAGPFQIESKTFQADPPVPSTHSLVMSLVYSDVEE